MNQRIILLVSLLFLVIANANADWVAGNSSVSPSSPIPACGTVTATCTFSWLSFNNYVNDSHLATLSYALPPSVIVSTGTPSLLVNNILLPTAIFSQNAGGWNCNFPTGTVFGPGTTLTFSVAGLQIVDTPGFTNQQLTQFISFVAGPPGENYTNNTSAIAYNTTAVPTMSLNATSTTVIVGQSVTLTAGGAITYTWDSTIVQNGLPFMPPQGTHVYTVTGTDANGCTASSSVSVIVLPATPLAAQYKSFTVFKKGSTDIVEWTTLSETNNSHFNIQRSHDGMQFTKLGTLSSKSDGASSSKELNYRFVDEQPALGHNYYRLEQVDLDGHKSYTEVIDIIWMSQQEVYSIYPNPANDIINIDLYTNGDIEIALNLTDISGRRVKSLQAKSINGLNHFSLPLNELAAGIYSVRISGNNSFLHMTKIRKK